MKEKLDYKSIVMSAAIGGSVYAIIMSVFYQFISGENFSITKFVLDFLLFGLLVGGIVWWSMRKGNKEKDQDK